MTISPKSLPLKPDFLFFAQHGWSDNGNDIGRLAQMLVASKTVDSSTNSTLVVAPSLGLLNTYWRIESLIKRVEISAKQIITQYPHVPIKIMGHSMGGLIWLEVLNRHPEWWHKVNCLVVIGSPVGGANIARIIDPLGIGIGIARDLGQNRRAIAESIAQKIPTLCIASDLGHGSDGLIAVETTKFAYSQYICVQNIPHAHLKWHRSLIPIIQHFWSNPQINNPKINLAAKVVDYLRNVPGMTDGNYRYLKRSQKKLQLSQDLAIRTTKNVAGVDHVFVTDINEQCLYAGYVGWLHNWELKKAFQELSMWSENREYKVSKK
jgi:pimeloyl-ACP methyl ester carboxylesterase